MSRASTILALVLVACLLLPAAPPLIGVASADCESGTDPGTLYEGGNSSEEGDPDELDGVEACISTWLKTPPSTGGGDGAEAPSAAGTHNANLAWLGELSNLIRLLSLVP